ncbi:N-acetylmuramoyl-L-alanine amidase [Marinomonas transparens]|uniref:N-acetylmuramoyl-L-alanine amidase n=1 Tax=Marinomonas transparens TaxID=2795388 RepID=A0A934N5L7_9GAMM|nr:N-acetylmuramoyl-L-alanine amidase [Marinomonas transparens]MBJ7537176.1 N-acetylmuramoyl-L-alanine amidase [Marinomonas transparens]
MGARRDINSINSVVIHCAATPNGRAYSAEQIDQWHKERNFQRDMSISPGYSPLQHIGYHFVIELDGTLKRGRPLEEVGAHAYGHNQASIGICMVGTDQFALAQWHTLLKLIQGLEAHLDMMLSLYGHNQLSSKICPGFDVPAWVKRKFRPLDKHLLEEVFNGLV